MVVAGLLKRLLGFVWVVSADFCAPKKLLPNAFVVGGGPAGVVDCWPRKDGPDVAGVADPKRPPDTGGTFVAPNKGFCPGVIGVVEAGD